ncbi:dipeptide/oligopeptide/nickel ABC transporter ATP-binding protein [Actinoplanes sp. NPDC023936]|uniref:ABC transporter ATP-binding protein n=1 Tax=Actinoplanes sp. NPDC023936 TaxID=3154910 RepID=UPI0034055BB7
MVQVTGLSVHRQGRALVTGVDLVCRPGERVALVGASGSGKSLTAKAVLGLLPPGLTAAGSVRIAGREVLGVPCARRHPEQRAAAVMQDSALALHPLIPIGQQLALPLRRAASPKAGPHEAGARQAGTRQAGARQADPRQADPRQADPRQADPRQAAVRDLLAAVDLPADLATRYPGQLSGGQRQRVCLALALATRPPLLIADEPTTALDVVTQAGIVRLLKDRTGGPDRPALLFITHDLAVAAELCTRFVVMHDGRVVEDGPAADVLPALPHGPTAAGADR